METVSIKPTFIAVNKGSHYDFVNPNCISRIHENAKGTYTVFYKTQTVDGESITSGELSRNTIDENKLNIIM